MPVAGTRAAGQFGHQGEAVDVGGLALVGRHAERGVALEVLDRAEALALGELDIGDGDVVLEIDEGLALGVLDAPERRHGRAFGIGGGNRHRPRMEAAGRGRVAAGSDAVGQAGGQGEIALGGAHHNHAGRQRARHEGRQGGGPFGAPAEVGREMHGRLPAARDREQVAWHREGLAARGADLDRTQVGAAQGPQHNAFDEPRTGLPGEGVEPRERVRTRVDDGRHGNPGGREVAGGPQRIVVVAEQDRPAARLDGEAVEIAAHGAGQHDAGPVVVGEHDRPLDGARGQDGALGHDAPEALARLVRSRHATGDR